MIDPASEHPQRRASCPIGITDIMAMNVDSSSGHAQFAATPPLHVRDEHR